ncbi:hypothetical protein ABTX35_09065 [Streptomyces sp. NPDC096080]|uniref:hypothetical protein n=1 Tax=Streptomyces sp. NPDC096080 TaxID=3156693 RepID=UPI0033321B8D
MSHDYRPGDVLLLNCPFTETVVTGVTRYRVSVRWPWWEVDPQAENFRWNGQKALPTPTAREWETFRTGPAETVLKPGDTCRVGIPATVVHAQAVHGFDPPLVSGMLPRPASYLEILQQEFVKLFRSTAYRQWTGTACPSELLS